MQIFRITVWDGWKTIYTVDYRNELDAQKARNYLMKTLPKDKKLRTRLNKKSLTLKDKFSASDYDVLFSFVQSLNK